MVDQVLGGTLGGIDGESQLVQGLGRREDLLLIVVVDGDVHAARLDWIVASCGDLRLVTRRIEVLVYSHDLSGGFHLGSQDGIYSGQLEEREYHFLHGVVVQLLVAAQSEVLELLTEHDLGGDLGHLDSGSLRYEGNGPGCSGVGLDHVDLLSLDRELEVHQTFDVQGYGDPLGYVQYLIHGILPNHLWRHDHGRITGVASCVFHVLQDTSDIHILSVGDTVHIDLDSIREILVDEDGVVPGYPYGALNICLEVVR